MESMIMKEAEAFINAAKYKLKNITDAYEK
jgi:hypothetical protein